MGGIYTAKAVVPTLPNVPPGWPTDWGSGTPGGGWPFPPETNMYPPGYSPEYSLVGEGPDEIGVDILNLPGDYALEVIFLIVDHGTYPTSSPLPGKIKLSANVEGSIRYFSGGAGILEYDYQTIGDFTGILKTVTVTLLEEDVDKELTILGETAAYWPDGSGDTVRWIMQDTVYIPIKEKYPKKFSITSQFNSWEWAPPGSATPKIEIKVTKSPGTLRDWPSAGINISAEGNEIKWSGISSDQIPEVTSTAAHEPDVKIETSVPVALSKDHSYMCDIWVREGGSCNVNATVHGIVTWSDGSTEQKTCNVIINAWSPDKWLGLYVSIPLDMVTWSGWT